MGQEINTQTSCLLDMIITGLLYLGRWRRKTAGVGDGTSLYTLTSILPSLPLIPLLSGQCLCSDKDFLLWSPWGQKRGGGGDGGETQPCGLSAVLTGWAVSGNALQTLRHQYQHTPKAQLNFNLSEADGWTAGRLRRGGRCMVFDESDGCQLFAEFLKHDHSFQQSHVVDTTKIFFLKSRQGGEKHLPNIISEDKRA